MQSEEDLDFEGRPSYESCFEIINDELNKRRSKWRLTAIAWMDYDDVCQKIRLHIFNKWQQWDPKRPLRPWLNTIISNQMTNLVRNNYSSFVKPCMQCPHNQGGDLCALYGSQNSQCIDFAKWEKSKKSAQEIKMPLSIHDKAFGNNESEYSSIEIKETCSYLDYESEIESFHKKIKGKLTLIEWKIYNFIYIENKNECEAAKLMGYKTSEKNRSPGYKQIKKIKNKIYKIAKDLMDEL